MLRIENTDSSWGKKNWHILLRIRFQIISYFLKNWWYKWFLWNTEGLSSELVRLARTWTGMLTNVIQRTQDAVEWKISQYVERKKWKFKIDTEKCNGNIYFLQESKSRSCLLWFDLNIKALTCYQTCKSIPFIQWRQNVCYFFLII